MKQELTQKVLDCISNYEMCFDIFKDKLKNGIYKDLQEIRQQLKELLLINFQEIGLKFEELVPLIVQQQQEISDLKKQINCIHQNQKSAIQQKKYEKPMNVLQNPVRESMFEHKGIQFQLQFEDNLLLPEIKFPGYQVDINLQSKLNDVAQLNKTEVNKNFQNLKFDRNSVCPVFDSKIIDKNKLLQKRYICNRSTEVDNNQMPKKLQKLIDDQIQGKQQCEFCFRWCSNSNKSRHLKMYHMQSNNNKCPYKDVFKNCKCIIGCYFIGRDISQLRMHLINKHNADKLKEFGINMQYIKFQENIIKFDEIIGAKNKTQTQKPVIEQTAISKVQNGSIDYYEQMPFHFKNIVNKSHYDLKQLIKFYDEYITNDNKLKYNRSSPHINFWRDIFQQDGRKKCQFCFRYINQKNISKHVRQCHSVGKLQKCPYSQFYQNMKCPLGCSLKISDESNMRTHLINNHKAVDLEKWGFNIKYLKFQEDMISFDQICLK